MLYIIMNFYGVTKVHFLKYDYVLEGINGVLYLLIFLVNGFNRISLLYCFMTSALLSLSVIDFYTYKIPAVFPLVIGALGMLRIILEIDQWPQYVMGCLGIGTLLYFLWLVSRGKAMGGGDVRLMAAAGLLLGWSKIMLAFIIGCILALVIHSVRMKVSHEGSTLAMGPYFSMGIFIAAIFGEKILQLY